MKNLCLCFFVVALVGCTPKEADDDDSKSAPAVAAASPAPKSGDWMWKKTDPKKDGWSLTSKGSLGGKNANDPLGGSNDPLNQKAKK